MVLGLVPYGGLSSAIFVMLLATRSMYVPSTAGTVHVTVASSFVVESWTVLVAICTLFAIVCPADKSLIIVPVMTIVPVCPGVNDQIFRDVVGVLKSVDGKVSVMITPLAVLPPALP